MTKEFITLLAVIMWLVAKVYLNRGVFPKHHLLWASASIATQKQAKKCNQVELPETSICSICSAPVKQTAVPHPESWVHHNEFHSSRVSAKAGSDHEYEMVWKDGPEVQGDTRLAALNWNLPWPQLCWKTFEFRVAAVAWKSWWIVFLRRRLRYFSSDR